MKKIKFLAVLAIAMFLMSCSKNDDVQQNNSSIQELAPESTVKMIEGMGFNTLDFPVLMDNNGYIVEGDISIDKETVNQLKSSQGISQRRRLSLIDCDKVKNIRIKNSLGNNKAGNAFDEAISRWNNVNGSTVMLIPVKKNPDITIRLDNNIGSYGVGAYPTYSGQPGSLIRIKLNFKRPDLNDGKVLNQKQWVNVLTHEIGHNLGFTHTDQAFYGTFIEGTIENDTKSIMTSSEHGERTLSAKGLSRYDKIAIRKMYNSSNKSLCHDNQ